MWGFNYKHLFILSQFWRLEIQYQDASRVGKDRGIRTDFKDGYKDLGLASKSNGKALEGLGYLLPLLPLH